MPSSLQSDDDFGWKPTGRWDSVDAVLASAGLTDAPQDKQREWIRRCYAQPGLRDLLTPLLPELQTRNLI